MDDLLKKSLNRLMTQYNTMHTSGGDHDNRYYTKTEVDTFMKSIASSSALTQLDEKLDAEITRATSVETLKAPLNSPTFTGTPTGPTASLGTVSSQLATTEFVKNSVDNSISNSGAMINMGTLGTGGTITSLPTVYKTGWTYKIISDGTYAGKVCEAGDMISSLVDREEGDAPNDDDWWVIQANINGAITNVGNSDGYIDISKVGSVVNLGHKNITKEDTTTAESLSFEGSFTAIKSIGVDVKGHINKVTTATFTLPTYSAGTGISLSGTTFSNSGVRGITIGDTNGTIKVNTGGTTAEVSVKGLGTAAYTNTKTSGTKTNTGYGTNGSYVPTMDFLSYWNGAYDSNGNSNLSYCSKGEFGTIITKSSSDYSLAGHTHNYAGSSSVGGAATSALACTGNASTATKLQTARTINGTSFDGSANITTANWGTSRTITIGNTGKSINGSANVSWTLSEIGAAASNHTHNYAGSSSAGGAATSALACTGNASTATKLQTARTLTIGSTGKSFDGSANVSWTLSEIGAAASSHTHSYLPLSGGTMTGNITYTGRGTSYIGNGSSDAANGVGGTLNNLVISSWWGVSFTTSCSGQAYTGTNAVSIDCRSGNVYAAKFNGPLSGNASTATKLQTARTLTIGSTGKSFDGSANVSWTLAEIGAAASSHTHTELKYSTYRVGLSSDGDFIPISGNIYCGTSGSPFSRVYATYIFEGGAELSSKYSNIGHNHDSTYLKQVNSQLTTSYPYSNVLTIRGNGNNSYSTGGLRVAVYGVGTDVSSDYGEITGTADNTCNLGQYHTRWKNVYAASGVVNTSDKNLKENIEPIDDKYKKLLLMLTPVSFKFKDGTSGRTHTGLISQEVEEKMRDCGLTDMDFAGFCKDGMTEEEVNKDGITTRVPRYNEDGTRKYIYSLRYEEFISIMLGLVQDMHKDIQELKEKINS